MNSIFQTFGLIEKRSLIFIKQRKKLFGKFLLRIQKILWK